MELKKRRYRKEEVREGTFDGEIEVADVIGKENIQIQFRVPENSHKQRVTGQHFGKAIKWHPRNKTLEVKLLFIDRVFEIEEAQCICAYRTEMPPKSKLPPKIITKVGKDGKKKRVPNPLYRLKVMEITRKDRDKLKVIWE